MYQRQIEKINSKIDKFGKAVIGLGCSFVQGQGAFDERIVSKYGTKFTELGEPLSLNDISEKEKQELIKEYPLLNLGPDKKIDFTFMEYENAFTNVLCEKYFNGEYAAINLGQRGCGNRATIKELYFYPKIHWHKLKEIIVIYCPSGPERFDFINDQWQDHGHWICMWPNEQSQQGAKAKLWAAYRENLHSDKFEVLEQIAHVQELLTWCKLHNAKLIITPSFDHRYDKDYFTNALQKQVQRTATGEQIESKFSITNMFSKSDNVDDIVNLFPWDNIFYPNKMPTFADMALKEEFPDHDKNIYQNYFWSFLGKGTPNNWITPCAHPSAKAHDLFAKLLYQHITNEQL